MFAPAHGELLRLIENEINIGFTFMESYALSFAMQHPAHADQALGDALASYEAASKFLDWLTPEEAGTFRVPMQKLRAEIASAVKG
jgi:hypothetical protein